jgi:hypothetical protein
MATTTPAADGASASRREGYVGSEACAVCHRSELAAWQGSDHDLAMQEANERTVLGDFGDASLEHAGVTSRFLPLPPAGRAIRRTH